MIVSVIIATDTEGLVKVCEVYKNPKTSPQYAALATAWNRFLELKDTYGGANVCLASRKVIE